MSSRTSSSNPVLTTLGLSASLLSSGGMQVVSLMTIPSLLAVSPQVAQKQFHLIYRIGRATQPPLTLATTAVLGYSAYLRSNSEGWYTSTTLAAGLVGSVLPWTVTLMEPVSWKIMRMSGVGEKGGELKVLLKRWSLLNFGRSLLPLAGGIALLWEVTSA